MGGVVRLGLARLSLAQIEKKCATLANSTKKGQKATAMEKNTVIRTKQIIEPSASTLDSYVVVYLAAFVHFLRDSKEDKMKITMKI